MPPCFGKHLVVEQVGIAMQRDGPQAPHFGQPVGRRLLEQYATPDFRRQVARHFERSEGK